VAISTLTAFKEFQKVTGWGEIGNATMTVSRLSLGYAVAVIVGLIIMRFRPSQILQAKVIEGIAAPVTDAAPASARSFSSKLVHAMRTAMGDFLDTSMYFTIGVIITSVFNTQVDQSILDTVARNEWLAVPAIMGLAMVLSLCSTSDAFIVAPMAVFSLASKLAFLVFGPMMDIKLLFMYSAVFKRRVVMAFLIGLFILIGSLSEPWIMVIQKLAAK
jgi:uncharacterized membrane protein YraQ (UPF0718 family)